MAGHSARQTDAESQVAPLSPPSRRDVWYTIGLGLALLVSIGATLGTFYLSWVLTAEPFRMFDGVFSPVDAESLHPSRWLTWGHASVASCFLITNLVNRRYGEQMALAHVVASSMLCALVAAAISSGAIELPQLPPLSPTLRQVAAFMTALMLGQAASVIVFDRTRGVEWWNAPAYSALTATLISMPLYYAFAYAGEDWVWLNRMAIDIALKAVAAFVLLIPYFLLRPVVRPGEGLGGF
ncbi:MAG: VUT family protein [Micropepsaceae bacterium]